MKYNDFPNTSNNEQKKLSNSPLPSNAEIEIMDRSEKKFNRKVQIASGKDIKHPNLRIVQRNVIYILGIKPKIAEKSILTSKQFFGQYGEISKIFISKKPFFLKHTNDFCHSAYVTYDNTLSASFAIAGLNNFLFEGKKMEASYATNKYCKSFLKQKSCKKKSCNYIHEEVDDNDCFIKGRGLDNRDIFQSQKVYAYNQIWNTNNEILEGLKNADSSNCQIPTHAEILKKVEEFFKKLKRTNAPPIEFKRKKYSAQEKLRGKDDSPLLKNRIDKKFSNKDYKLRQTGYFYRLNFEQTQTFQCLY